MCDNIHVEFWLHCGMSLERRRGNGFLDQTSSKTFNTWILKTLMSARVYYKLFMLGSETETRGQCAKSLTFHCSSEAIHEDPQFFSRNLSFEVLLSTYGPRILQWPYHTLQLRPWMEQSFDVREGNSTSTDVPMQSVILYYNCFRMCF
jgi:hypothetical protein